ncbi:hypothetical protein KAM353_15710 [Aeromonas caviae]|uniref:Uncharacterized protein n=1 Tax=Aeromonas caviae TaxID=648 RepID=A0AA37CVK6_AERCA|nr:hypothetical protein KAM336_15750 [Aeromonas caviae]GJA27003.1 hypothetical protein KAM340_11700 [Aeromonas caviae]GJA62614.1 hypothetical protein KAM351_12250 [Aeromonas caviae]GJA71924.1 hypothetical protein KAM353_15710 [Aeromonas caviae]
MDEDPASANKREDASCGAVVQVAKERGIKGESEGTQAEERTEKWSHNGDQKKHSYQN